MCGYESTVWVKKIPPRPAVFWHFSQTVEIFKSIFTHPLHVPIYARLQIFIQLSQTLTKLCHIKCDYLHIICSKCPPFAEKHAFRRLWKSLIVLLIVVCGKSSQICCYLYNYIRDINKHVGFDMTSTMTSFAQWANLEVKFYWNVKKFNGSSRLIWHNFVKVGDNWIKICNLA